MTDRRTILEWSVTTRTGQVCWAILLAVVIASAGGCGGSAHVRERTINTVTAPDGTTTTTETERESKVVTPPKPVEPGTATIGDRGSAASTGRQDAPDQAIAQLQWMPWIGAAMVAVGVLSIVGRAWLPFLSVLPLGASWAIVAFGAGLIALPTLLDRYAAWLMFAVLGGGAVAIAWAVGLFDNWKTRQQPDIPDTTTGATP